MARYARASAFERRRIASLRAAGGAKGKSTPDALGGYVLLQNTTRPHAWVEWLEAAGVKNVNGLRGPKFQHMAMIIEAAAAGLGVALVPRMLVANELAAGRLVVLCDRPLRSRNAYFLVYPDEIKIIPWCGPFATG